jgi:hypothetical protein
MHDSKEAVCRRQRAWRARQKVKREAVALAAKAAHKADLAARRAGQGLPPIKTGAERVQEHRARVEAVQDTKRLESWYSLPSLTADGALAYLQELHPTEPIDSLLQLVGLLQGRCQKHNLILNKFVCRDGVESARIKRAVLFQCWAQLNGCEMELDAALLAQAMAQAEQREQIDIPESHPTWYRQELARILDFSQTMLGDGGYCRREPLP